MKEFVAIVLNYNEYVNVSCRSPVITLEVTVHTDLLKYRAYGYELTTKAHTTGLKTE